VPEQVGRGGGVMASCSGAIGCVDIGNQTHNLLVFMYVFIYFYPHLVQPYSSTHLLVLGDGEEQPRVQLGVVLGQGLVAVVVDELHHRQEGEGLREAVAQLPVVDLDQLVVAALPVRGGGDRK